MYMPSAYIEFTRDGDGACITSYHVLRHTHTRAALRDIHYIAQTSISYNPLLTDFIHIPKLDLYFRLYRAQWNIMRASETKNHLGTE